MSAKPGSSSFGLKLAIVVVILAVGAYLAFRQLRPVAEVEPVVSGMAQDAKPASVTVKVEYEMELQSEIGGRMIDDGFTLDQGKSVKKGEVVARIDGGDLELDIQQVKNDLKAARAKVAVGSSIKLELEGARADLDNEERLYKMGQVAELDLKKARRLVEGTEQRLALEKVNNQQSIDTLQVLLEQKERQLSKMTIRAPFNGVVSDVYAHPGQQIGNNFAIAKMITQHRLVEARISEEDFADIKVGEPASVILLPYGDFVFSGHVSRILPMADPTTQRHLVWIDLDDETKPSGISQEKLVPGITGDATITINEHQASAIIPRRALFGDYVYVVHNGVVELKKVKKGAVWTLGIEVLPMDKQGPPPLVAGDLVIVEDLDKFHEGDRVQVREFPSDALPKRR